MSIQEIINEYNDYKPTETGVTSTAELHKHLLLYEEDIKESIKAYKEELSDNRKMYLEARIRNFFFFIFQEEETEFYYYDNAIIKDIIKEMYLQLENIKDIIELVDDSNYQELFKLVEFMMMHYDNNIDFLENERRRLALSLENATYYNQINDSRKAMKKFMEQILSTYYDRLISIEKIKKIW